MAVGPLQLPQYQQAGDLNWAPLAELGKTLQTNTINNQRKEALSLSALGQGGAVDYGKAANTLASLGDIEGASKFAAMQKALSPESTPDIQNYNYAAKNPAFLPYLKQQAEAKATKINNTTNVSNVGEREYDKAMSKELADLNVGIIKGSLTARNNQANIDRLDQLLSDPSVYQGTGGERVLQAKRLAKSMGLYVGDVGGAEAVQAISNQLALQARNPAGGAGMPGAMSDSDRNYLKAMQPGLEKTPEGNKLIIDVNRKINQRAMDVEKFRQDYIRKNGRLNEGFYSALNDWSDKNPLFPQVNQSAPATRSAAPTQGARQAPDGKFYVPDPNRPGKYLRVEQ